MFKTTVQYFTAASAILGITAGILTDIYAIPPLSLPPVFVVLGSSLIALGLLTLIWEGKSRLWGLALLVLSAFVVPGGFTVEAIMGVTAGLFAVAWDADGKRLALPVAKGSLLDYWLRGFPIFLLLVALWSLSGTLLACLPPLGFGSILCQSSDPSVVSVFLIGAGGFVSLGLALSIKWAHHLARRPPPPYQPE